MKIISNQQIKKELKKLIKTTNKNKELLKKLKIKLDLFDIYLFNNICNEFNLKKTID